MVRSKAKSRAAKAAALMLSIPVMAQAMTAAERVPLPPPRPAWLDAQPAEALDNATLMSGATEHVAPILTAAAHAHVPLPVARPDWLDGLPADPARIDTPTYVETKMASMPAHVPLPIPRPDFLDALSDDDNDDAKGVTRMARSTDPEQMRASALSPLHAMIEDHARHHGVPLRLAHRIVQQESRYNPALKAKAHYGLMQVSLPTAKSMGYAGDVTGLLDAKTNLTFAMPYLANAWIVSGGNEDKARRLYMTGYYPEAKRKGVLKDLRNANSPPLAGPMEAADAR